MSFLSAIPIIGKVLEPVFNIIDKAITDKDEANRLKAEIRMQMASQNHEQLTEHLKSATSIILAEAKGGWLQRNWRPMLMLTTIAIVANNYIIYPYLSLFWPDAVTILELPDWLFKVMLVGVGGYVGGRSVEKLADKGALPWQKKRD
jgi:hypothetical protein